MDNKYLIISAFWLKNNLLDKSVFFLIFDYTKKSSSLFCVCITQYKSISKLW